MDPFKLDMIMIRKVGCGPGIICTSDEDSSTFKRNDK